jgi:hypothetical protein
VASVVDPSGYEFANLVVREQTIGFIRGLRRWNELLQSEEAMLVTMMKERDEDKNPHESDE